MSSAVLLAAAASTHAQSNNPSAHFGASTVPSREAGTYLSLSFDRFTPTGKVTEPGTYNEIDRTIGFNFLSVGGVRRPGRWPNVSLHGSLQLGWGHDEPTAWIQDRLHRLASLPPVASTNPRNHVFDAAASGEAFWWTPVGGWADQFTGIGASVGTPFSETWFQTGVSTNATAGWPAVSASVRVGVPFLGGAFPDSTITDVYAAMELKTDFPLADWLSVDWLPSVFVAARQDTGFFTDRHDRPIPELHGTFGFVAADGSWRFEAWNEYFGGRFKDIGPTGGGRISIRLPGFPGR